MESTPFNVATDFSEVCQKVSRPVFFIGCPRSGTTITLDLICSHPSFAWVSNHVNWRPQVLSKSRLVRVYDLPMIGRSLYLHKRRFRRLPFPVEAWRFWNYYLENFQWERGGEIPPRRRTEDDISMEEVNRIRSVVEKICDFQKKPRFVAKYTDFPRIRYLSQAFPDALFIHLMRDGRAVVNSWCNMMKKGQMMVWLEREWWIRGWPAEWRAEFTNEACTSVGFVAYHWKFFLREIRQEASLLPSDRYLEVNYRDVMTNSHVTFEKILKFCGLDMTSRVCWYLEHKRLENRNWKWQEQLSDDEKTLLNRIIREEEFTQLLDKTTA